MTSPYGRSKENRFNDKVKIESSDKDILISQLKAQIFELEQNEKNFNALNHKFRNLQNDFNLQTEEKLKNEYEFKQRTESNLKLINELKSDLENVTQAYNEKLSLNKKLYSQLEKVEKILENANNENDQLRADLNELNRNYANLNEERNSLERTANDLDDLKQRNQIQIEKLIDDNSKLKRSNDDQERNIKNLETERARLLGKIDDFTFEINNLNQKLKSREETLLNTQKALDESKQVSNRFQNKTNELEIFNEGLKKEIDKLRFENSRESKGRQDQERQNQELERILKDREIELRKLNDNLDFSRLNNDKLVEDNEKLFGELEKLKSHVILLTEQNQKFSEELDSFVDQDEKIRIQLNRRERVQLLKKSNQFYLEKSLSKFEDNDKNSRNFSPKQTNSSLNRSRVNN